MQIMEVKNDSVMKRTMRRPLPSGRLSRAHALAWAIGMGVSGVSLLAYQVNNGFFGLLIIVVCITFFSSFLTDKFTDSGFRSGEYWALQSCLHST